MAVGGEWIQLFLSYHFMEDQPSQNIMKMLQNA